MSYDTLHVNILLSKRSWTVYTASNIQRTAHGTRHTRQKVNNSEKWFHNANEKGRKKWFIIHSNQAHDIFNKIGIELHCITIHLLCPVLAAVRPHITFYIHVPIYWNIAFGKVRGIWLLYLIKWNERKNNIAFRRIGECGGKKSNEDQNPTNKRNRRKERWNI